MAGPRTQPPQPPCSANGQSEPAQWHIMKLTYASATDWATREPQPDPAEIEVYAAQRNLDIVDTLMGYSKSDPASAHHGKSRKSFAYVLEEYVLPAVGGAALVVGLIMLSPSSIWGDSITYWGSSGKSFEVDTVDYSNLDSRIMLATIISLVGLVLLAGNAIARALTKGARSESAVISWLMMAVSVGSIVYIVVLGNEGFDGFTVPLITHVGVIIAGIANIVIYRVNRRRKKAQGAADAQQSEHAGRSSQPHKHGAQRYATATAQFNKLAPQRQQEILADRAQAVHVLVSRGMLHPQVEQDLSHLRFGELTAALSAARTPA